MPASDIVIKGAREHNLRDVDLVLPRNKLICLTGVSGSGKSSLAFDTLYAEGQRRYVESLSTFARQFLGQMPKPDVDFLGGLSPTISISQKTSGRNPRSTVGTITEIYDYLRVLYARVGQGHCPKCHRPITAQTREAILARILSLPEKTRFSVLAPIVRQQKGEFRDLFQELLRQGFVRARVDGTIISLTDNLSLDRQMRHNIEVVIDRLVVSKDVRTRLAEAVETALKVGQGNLVVAQEMPDEPADRRVGTAHQPTHQSTEGTAHQPTEGTAQQPTEGTAHQRNRDPAREDERSIPQGRQTARTHRSGLLPGDIALSADYACTHCGLSFQPPSPQLFSFNSPQGMCLDCDGLGEFYSFDPHLLVTDPSKTFKEGCIEVVGTWQDLGRWKRHIYEGLAETMERLHELPQGTLLDTPWEDLADEHREILLWGTGDEHITYTWRVGRSTQKYGGKYDGIIPELLQKYRNSKSRPQINKLEKYMSVIRCPDCQGQRLNSQARSVTLTTASPAFADNASVSLPDLCDLPVRKAVEFFQEITLQPTQQKIAVEVLKEIRGRLGFLMDVGLDYLTLSRTAPTLSGGESQRIRLAGQIGCGLVGVLYILDEPSIGLHARDNDRLLSTLARLRDQGNTVIVVEHDEDTMRAADYLVDFGPGAGVRGGHIVAAGSDSQLTKSRQSVTGAYLAGKRKIAVPKTRRTPGKERLKIVSASHNNLKDVDVEIPLGVFVCVTGVSGSGKSSLVNDILVEALRRDLNNGKGEPGGHKRISGLKHLDKLIAIDQSPIGRTPRSNPATYIKVFDDIRSLYAQLPESKRRGYKPGRFSFNVKGGRCEACEGNGSNKLEMDFLADVWVTCPVCEGHRFNHETLQVQFRGKSISDVLEMDIQEALTHFENIPAIAHKLQTLHDVGLDYIKLGQPSPTLSGGEAQRIKLARELVKKSTGRTLYLLDEPTTGLHFADIEMLLKVLQNFVEAGNTVLVVEHNLDVIKTADWIIDIGPEGGEHGGRIVAAGTPEQVAASAGSHTGAALAPVLRVAGGKVSGNGAPKSAAKARKRSIKEATHIRVEGARQHNLRDLDVKVPREQMTVCCGPSGSGKSSLAMDTIYAEGQRRYVESLSSYARQFVGQMQKPAIEHIEGLSPSIAIEQRHLGHTPRSTVGTVTEIYDYFRILFARLGQPHCPDCDIPVGTQSADEVIDKILAEPEGTRLYLMAPLEIEVGEEYASLWEEIRASGYVRVRIDGQTFGIDDLPQIDRRRRHEVEVVVDRIVVRNNLRARIADTVENALALGRGVVHVAYPQDDVEERKWRVLRHSQHRACERCGRSFEELTPHHFSFNSAIGWCPSCEGLGTQTGANPAALLRDTELSLADGAVLLWPNMSEPLAAAMLQALSRATGIPVEVPYQDLSSKQRRQVLFGTGGEWFTVEGGAFRCQYKGLYPALEEAARLSPGLRSRLDHLVDEIECSECGGSRLRDDASAVRLRKQTIEQISRTPLDELLEQVKRWKLSARERKIAGELVREIKNRLTFLVDVGLEYLTIGRSAPTLSGGESQRIRLASQVGSGLCGVLYVLDEPTIGLHPRDNRRLIAALHKLRDLGNTLLVVEHDREVVASADRLLDFGPAAGRHGGQIVAEGTPGQVSKRRKSVTGPYLSGKKAIPVPTNRRISDSRFQISDLKEVASSATDNGQRTTDQSAIYNLNSEIPFLRVLGARHHNLKNIDVTVPLGALTVVAGVSGSGKSSLVNDILHSQLARILHRARTNPGAHDEIVGIEQINKVIRVDQQALGNTPTSNPATYSGVFELIRQLFAQLPDAKVRGFQPRRFSFNVPGGRCDDCEGAGQKCIEMHFLPDVWVECETCLGRRYNPETLAVKYRGKSIADVLEMSCSEALSLFENIPKIRRILQTLCDVGLGYVTLGQAAPTLSGGEAQRVKLAAELARPDTGRTLYLLDEPTTGLHFDDLAKLLDVLHRLVDLGNTVVVIEHNLDVMKQADWIIELGPEAGAAGGYLVAAGPPEYVVEHGVKSQITNDKSKTNPKSGIRKLKSEIDSPTARELAPILAAGPHKKREVYDPQKVEAAREGDLDIADVGRDAHMPWETDGRRWHTKDRVGRDGTPCKWDGRILDEVERRIQEKGQFSPTNWNARSVVEVSAEKKSDGWFFHAITGETWLLKMKFRVAKRTFRREDLLQKIRLVPLDELHDVPLYSDRSRVRCKNIRGPWQEVQIDAHSWNEIDTPEFWDFVDQAIVGFESFTERLEQNPEDVMPWKKLGQKWHLSRKGFPPGKQPAWENEVLEELVSLLTQTAPDGQFLWNNQQVVHLFLPQQRDPWASIYTKRLDALDLTLCGPKDEFALGRIAGLGADRDVATDRPDHDTVKLRFIRPDEVASNDLAAFIEEHYNSVRSAAAVS